MGGNLQKTAKFKLEKLAGRSAGQFIFRGYPALLRLQQKGWITAEWGVSDKNRRAKFYSLAKSGRKQLEVETAQWEQMAAIVARVLAETR